MNTRTIIIHSLIHDLKVPLAVIELGILPLLTQSDKSGRLTDQQIEILRIIRNENARAKHLTNRLLNAARLESPIENFVRSVIQRPILRNIKRVLVRQSNSSNYLLGALGDLKISLSDIEDKILSLNVSSPLPTV